jgi:hypothetical protein
MISKWASDIIVPSAETVAAIRYVLKVRTSIAEQTSQIREIILSENASSSEENPSLCHLPAQVYKVRHEKC